MMMTLGDINRAQTMMMLGAINRAQTMMMLGAINRARSEGSAEKCTGARDNVAPVAARTPPTAVSRTPIRSTNLVRKYNYHID